MHNGSGTEPITSSDTRRDTIAGGTNGSFVKEPSGTEEILGEAAVLKRELRRDTFPCGSSVRCPLRCVLAQSHDLLCVRSAVRLHQAGY